MSREEATAAAQAAGARVASSVSKKTDFVVVGADPGSKAAKAEQLGVEMIDEQEFRKRLGRTVGARPSTCEHDARVPSERSLRDGRRDRRERDRRAAPAEHRRRAPGAAVVRGPAGPGHGADRRVVRRPGLREAREAAGREPGLPVRVRASARGRRARRRDRHPRQAERRPADHRHLRAAPAAAAHPRGRDEQRRRPAQGHRGGAPDEHRAARAGPAAVPARRPRLRASTSSTTTRTRTAAGTRASTRAGRWW